MKQKLRLGDCYALTKHKRKQYSIRYFSLLAVLTTMCLYAVKQVSAQQAEPAATAVADIIGTDAKSQYGMLAVHEVDGKICLEIPDSLLGRDILAVNRLAKGWAGDKPFDPFLNFLGFSGDLVNENLFRFDRESDDAIIIYPLDYSNRVQTDDDKLALPVGANVLPILHSFPVLCRNRADDGSLVDATDFVFGDNTIMTFSASLRLKFGVGGWDSRYSHLESVETSDAYMVTSSVKTYTYRNGENIRMGISSTWFLLPETPMVPLFSDPNVGYMTLDVTDYTDPLQGLKKVRLVKRWRMEPKSTDIEAYEKGELVEPAKPIVFYIDPSFPEAWVPYIKNGVEAWNEAFLHAGFTNAIRAVTFSEQEAQWRMGDARYSVICYKPSAAANVTGDPVADPRSGEIVNAQISWHQGMAAMIRRWTFILGAPTIPAARKWPLDIDVVGPMVQSIISHEVGHTLGLLHNFGASSTVSVENLRSREWLSKNPISPSIMDYVRLNFVAQPKDSVRLNDLFPRIGEYDKWAIEWGYSYRSSAKKKVAEKGEILPGRWYGAEDRQYTDPHCQAEDLGNDPVEAGKYGIRNLQHLMGSLHVWGGAGEGLAQRYREIVEHFTGYMARGAIGLGQLDFAKAPALDFLQMYFFNEPSWLLDNAVVQQEVGDPYKYLDPMQRKLMEAVILNVLQGGTGRKIEQIQKLIFSELVDGNTITPYRRNLQRVYLEIISAQLSSGRAESIRPFSEHQALAYDLLGTLVAPMEKACRRTDDPATKRHLASLLYYLKNQQHITQ